ncbi:uncharacterized protein PAC_19945 [Phialocephala subalpina]|uniref:Heterokaryon incompatibility domain-containing protein n=1 Tax=Phialocephala subalpina TaxID=576137 RepID=A0A1L7XYF9_9HELO|nr:uncharacterized protein PAC_19945 [Phialocephala subalpina]
MSQNYCCEHGVWGPDTSWVTYPFANFQDSRANRCSACAMLLEAVDKFLPGWTREGCGALRSIRLRHTQFLISVTLLEDEEEVAAFYLSRSSTVFLVEPTGPVQYVSLSYCWGPDVGDVLKTTSRNIESHFQRLPFSLVPQTIRDAMTICWELGVPYMWVDSLCIIQDDLEDWLCESSKMMDIYAFSHFTITLKEPASCKLGFLWALLLEKSKSIQPHEDHGAIPTGSLELWVRRSIAMGYISFPRRSLDERAWSLQESVLPNRKLAFCDKEMEWVCLQTSKWESMLGEYALSLKTTLGQGFGPDKYQRGFDLDYDWRNVVEEYSNRTLSQETDKLTAISGLATIALKAKFQMSKNQEHEFSQGIETDPALSPLGLYVAGLWRSSFVTGLAWSVNEHKLRPGRYEQHKRQSKYRAPTWSWASIDGPVRYTERDNIDAWKYKAKAHEHIQVEELECTPLLTSNPTGPVSVGFAIVTGPLVEVQLAVLDTELSSTWISTHRKSDIEPPAEETHISVVRDEKLRTYKVELDLWMDPTVRVDDPNSRDWIRGQSGLRSRGWSLNWKYSRKPESAKFEINGTRFFCLRTDLINAYFANGGTLGNPVITQMLYETAQLSNQIGRLVSAVT